MDIIMDRLGRLLGLVCLRLGTLLHNHIQKHEGDVVVVRKR